jgi:glyoxylase-like metal-dependent hydrolase (beta-lactamase superfamily II)
VLVDSGIGFSFAPAEGKLMRLLEAIAVEPDDIDTILLTHAHGDHCGGNADSEGKVAFKQARYIMHKAEWDFWTSESVLAQPQHEWMMPVVYKNLKPLRVRSFTLPISSSQTGMRKLTSNLNKLRLRGIRY